MNRKDKIQKIHNKRQKRVRAKSKTSSKEPYVSKCDRPKEESENSTVASDAEKECDIK
ncbi:MAG: DUF2986 domain-containing protein [Sulfurimonas sp.]|nr:DUF2986 domain-containing protein [Sulfurimonas sp.]